MQTIQNGVDTNLQHFSYAILNAVKDGENIFRHCLRVWDLDTWSPCLHHAKELLVLNDAKASQVLRHPFDTFNTKAISQPRKSRGIRQQTLTGFLYRCEDV